MYIQEKLTDSLFSSSLLSILGSSTLGPSYIAEAFVRLRCKRAATSLCLPYACHMLAICFHRLAVRLALQLLSRRRRGLSCRFAQLIFLPHTSVHPPRCSDQ
ncbi:hypothetical protein VFPPC_03819 [Pochonia chlamydosporia 170]|uniref:Uncharacterized protein n=1 Tax=Pochonia chlamydosporia 170 TaxID=1380566 RepID=A0A179F2I9_METCM|nr:hypothetical protein VFPPC_03819 [Pochonia chlamydosporia 170]OAQ59591.2 hypothetical protein VFPPC_03819 [Pochonia chlamydosporia 170]